MSHQPFKRLFEVKTHSREHGAFRDRLRHHPRGAQQYRHRPLPSTWCRVSRVKHSKASRQHVSSCSRSAVATDCFSRPRRIRYRSSCILLNHQRGLRRPRL